VQVWLDGRAIGRKSILSKNFQLDGTLLNDKNNNQQKKINWA